VFNGIDLWGEGLLQFLSFGSWGNNGKGCKPIGMVLQEKVERNT
jgi:hypothetical protein